MPFFRLIVRGAMLAIRSKKRTYTFLILFMILSAWITLQVSRLDAYSTDNLVRLQGVVLEPTEEISAKDSYSKLSNLNDYISPYIRGMYIVYFYELIPNEIGLVSILPFGNKYSPSDIPWVLEEFKPTKIISGRYIISEKEGIANADFSLEIAGTMGISLFLSGSIGFVIRITKGDKVIDIRIVGFVNSSQPGFSQLTNNQVKNIIYVPPETFKDILERIVGLETLSKSSVIFVRRVVAIVQGGLALSSLKKNLQEVYDKISQLSGELEPFSLKSIEAISPEHYHRDLMMTLLIVMMALFMGVLYAYIIVRFRHRDIAILRAIGWRKKDVHLLMLGEFMYVTVVGYFLSILLSSVYTILVRAPQLTSSSLIISLAIIVIAIMFGYIFISRRVLKIAPMEAFRMGGA